MNTGLTPSEKFVTELCHRAFLKLWTHPNPFGKNDKELCDCLIVCGSHVVIISVKEIEYKDTGDKTGWDRWHRKAIDASVDQIWGAERWIAEASAVVRKDKRVITLPPKDKRTIHRIAVSLGAKGQTPVRWGELGHGFVHVCDEFSLNGIFLFHDTITDFIDYLVAVESFVRSGVGLKFIGGGSEDLLALYVQHGPRFGIPDEVELKEAEVVVTAGVWKSLIASSDFKDLMRRREESYAWDNLIEMLSRDLLTDGMFDMHSKEITKSEEALIEMARQPRNYRAELGTIFIELLKSSGENRLKARAVSGANDAGFVFLTGKHSKREGRARELEMRCFVARNILPAKTIVGIATDSPAEGKGYSVDLLYMFFPTWTQEQAGIATKIQTDLGYFKNLAKKL